MLSIECSIPIELYSTFHFTNEQIFQLLLLLLSLLLLSLLLLLLLLLVHPTSFAHSRGRTRLANAAMVALPLRYRRIHQRIPDDTALYAPFSRGHGHGTTLV